MFKIIGFILVVLVALSFLNPQTREYLNESIQNIFFKEAKEKAKERQLIGSTDVYSPRVEEIQNILKSIGFFPGPVDGLMGRRTRQAIKTFQKQKDLNPTGIINERTYSELLKERESRSRFLVTKTQTTDLDYLKELPKLEKTPEKIAEIAGPQRKEKVLPQDKKRQIQIALKNAGFYKGKIDGKFGPQTIKAIKEFQKKNGLKADGIVGKNTWEKLKIYLY